MSSPQIITSRVLRHLLSLRRPYGSPEEGSVIPYLLSVLPALPSWVDPAGNLHVDGRTNHRHRTLFVGHTDTVHRTGGPNVFRETPTELHAGGGQCLGADDAAGVAIMAAMVGVVPAYYIFTRGEECGGIGSKHLAEDHPGLLKQFDRAIAFDRKGTGDVITHQCHGRCASDLFAWALADALNDHGMFYAPSNGGVYTDTAEFLGLIPECTNLSAGYYREHSKEERLDLEHHTALLSAALAISWDELPIGEPEPAEEADWPSWDGDEPPCRDSADEAIRDAVYGALDGDYRDLLGLIAQNLNPEYPDVAQRFLSPRALSEPVLLEALGNYSDWAMVLEHLSDEAHVPF